MPAEVHITPEHKHQLVEEERNALAKAQQMDLPDGEL